MYATLFGATLFAATPFAATSFASSQIAGGVVQSDEWVVRRDKNEEEFTGHVRFDRARDHGQSDWALYEKGKGLWKLKGGVHGLRETEKGEILELWADEADYHMDSKDGRARGTKDRMRFRRTFTRKGQPVVWDGTAQEAVWNGGDQRMRLLGGVTVDGADIFLRSRAAVWDQATRKGELQGGRPVGRFSGERYVSACQADVIGVSDDPQTIEAHGGVTGWFVMKGHGTKRPTH